VHETNKHGEPHFNQLVNGLLIKRETLQPYEVSLVFGPLPKDRYYNHRCEAELIEFKAEIKSKFKQSQMNSTYVFPRAEEQVTNLKPPFRPLQQTLENSNDSDCEVIVEEKK
jgi:hypothetical protein